ncbi:Rha family transcriptional regulator [Cloacibacillus evryensis]|uniref:Rha family transcriptional regulator n=2 Tax=Cloacibacillus evryensis TaxID=508460 RepID=UPI000240DE77|nr:hypothetical protein HMPREF1006_02432 [Synergistes sp. 3_1_syn1]
MQMNTPLRLKCDTEFAAHNFVQSSYLNSHNKEYPEYLMTRLGFSVLAMHTTELGIIIEAAPCGVCVLPDV